MVTDVRPSDFRHFVLRKNGRFLHRAIFDVTRNRRPRRETQQSVHVTLMYVSRGEKNRQSSTVAFALTDTSQSHFLFLFFFRGTLPETRYDLGERAFESKRFHLLTRHTNI